MIFSEGNHIQQIIYGIKTQTRRASNKYQIGKTYSIQPCRTCKGIKEGRILITDKRLEHRIFTGHSISEEDALAEGGYTQQEFYYLYKKIHPMWMERYVYTFKFIPQSSTPKAKNNE